MDSLTWLTEYGRMVDWLVERSGELVIRLALC